MSTFNILISGTSFWNPGDDFVRDGVIEILKKLYLDKKLNFLFYNFNEDFLPYSKFRGVHNMVAPGDISKFAPHIDLVVIAGLPVGREIKDLYLDIIRNGLQNKVILVGAGYENFYIDRHIVEYPEVEIFKSAKIITGRTAKKPPLFDEFNLNYHHINCPALLSVPEVKDIPKSKQIEHIGFSIQIPHEQGIVNQATGKEMFELSMKIMQQLYGSYKITLVAHHKSEYFPFLNFLKKRGFDIDLRFSSFYQDFHDIYRDFDLVVSTRLHACLYGLGHGIPGIVINDTGRHVHCLDGFIYVPWVKDENSFFAEFENMKKLNLHKVAIDVKNFKQELFAKYTAAIAPVLGLQIPAIKENSTIENNSKTALNNEFKTDLKTLFDDKKINSILYIRTDSIGDAVISMGLLEQFKKRFKDAKITVFVQNHIQELYEECDFVGEIIGFDKKRFNEDNKYRIGIIEEIKKREYGLLINPIYSRDSICDIIAHSTRAKIKIAYEGDNSNLDEQTRLANNRSYDYLVSSSTELMPEIRRNEKFLASIGIENVHLEPWIWLRQDDVEFAERFFKEKNLDKSRTIAFFGAGQYRIRDYPHFEEVVKLLSARYNFNFVCLGSEKDRELHEQIFGNTEVEYINICGELSLRQSAALIMNCRLALGVETAFAHIATAVGTPSFVILGGGHFGRFFPYDKLQSGIINPMECFNCNWICKYPKAYCLTEIVPENIVKAIEQSFQNSQEPKIFYADEDFNLLKDLKQIEDYTKKFGIELKKVVFEESAEIFGNESLPMITVITPTFNQAKYIEKTILSVLAQDYPNFEHIIIDGCSTDGTIEILKNYPHLKWISEKDNGQTEALNKGLRMAKGEIIAWINSDDYYFDGVFSEVAKFFIENPNEKVVHGNAKMGIESTQHTIDLKHFTYDFEEILQYWYGATMPTQPSVFFKREIVEKYGFFDESLKYAMDFEYWCRISRFHKFNHINKFFSYYLLHNNSKSGEANEWSQFYPEWHLVYTKYKKDSMKIPKNKLLTIFIPFSTKYSTVEDLNGLHKYLRFAANQRMRDAEIIIYTDFNNQHFDDAISGSAIEIQIIHGYNFSDENLLKIIRTHASGTLIHYPDYRIEYIPDWYSLSVHKILESFDKTNLLTDKGIIGAEKEFFKKVDLLGPDKIVKKDFLIFNTLSDDEGNAVEAESTDLIFSVIIPTYNRINTLMKCIEALENQSMRKHNYEIIVVDDGSNDETQEVLDNYITSINFKYIRQNNSGPGAARNKGIIQAKGKYVLIINDDTISSPHLLSNHLKLQRKYADRKYAILGTFDYVGENLSKPFTNFLSKSPMVFPFPAMIDGETYNYRYFITCNISIIRQALIEAGLFDEDFKEPMMEDTELGYRLQKLGYSVLYSKLPKAEHDHSMDIKGFCKRQLMSGRNLVKFIEKHPEVLNLEKNLFGFSELNEQTILNMKKFIKMKESEVSDAIAKLNEIEKFEISGSKILFNNVELDINIEQLHNFINQSINDIHLVHYFNGIIDSYEKLKMSTPVVTSKKSFKQKKILFTMFGWNESGGGTMFPRETAIELAGRGYGVTVFFAGLRHPKIDSPYYIERSHDRGVDLIGVYNRKFDFIVPNEPELEIRDEKVIRAFEQVLESVNPDIIHFQNFLGLSFGIAEIASSYNCKKFFTPHNYHVLDPQLYMFKQNGKKWEGIDFAANSDFARNFPYLLDKYTERNKKAVEIVTNSIDRVLAISSRVKELFIKGGIPERKISVVHQIPLMHNGKYKLNERTTSLPLKIGYFGSLIPHKGVHILVEAVQFLNSAKINVKLYGKGPQDYVAWLKSLDKHKVCEFKGEYLRENLGAIASGLDLVVVPSIWEEGAGLVILEAHYYGLPVICSKIGGMPEFIKNYENGLLFESGNIVELSNILNDLIKFPNKIDFMKNQTRLEKSFFDIVDYLEKIYFSYDNNVEDFMI